MPREPVTGQPEAFGFRPADKTRRTPTTAELESWKAESGAWLSGLSSEDRRVIAAYTGGDASEFNDELRDNRNASPADSPDTRLLFDAVSRAPIAAQPRTVMRGVYSPAEGQAAMAEWARRRFPIGATWVDRGFLSTTRRTTTAVRFASNGLVFEMRSRRGVYLSDASEYPFEVEYLFRPGVRWRVVGHAEDVAYLHSPKAGQLEVAHHAVVFLVDEDELTSYDVPPSGNATAWDD